MFKWMNLWPQNTGTYPIRKQYFCLIYWVLIFKGKRLIEDYVFITVHPSHGPWARGNDENPGSLHERNQSAATVSHDWSCSGFIVKLKIFFASFESPLIPFVHEQSDSTVSFGWCAGIRPNKEHSLDSFGCSARPTGCNITSFYSLVQKIINSFH